MHKTEEIAIMKATRERARMRAQDHDIALMSQEKLDNAQARLYKRLRITQSKRDMLRVDALEDRYDAMCVEQDRRAQLNK